jgi:oligopeptide/dipeptide ABC transporter ATP-binding protein
VDGEHPAELVADAEHRTEGEQRVLKDHRDLGATKLPPLLGRHGQHVRAAVEHELSGGQRQHVVIAGALVLEPELLVGDEPMASLDASVRGEILALLLRLRAELRLSALVATHELELAWSIADRVAVMHLGRIMETGDVEQVLTSPQHPYTQALLSAEPDAPGDRVVLTGEPSDPSRIPFDCRFHARCQILAGGKAERAGVAEAWAGPRIPAVLGRGGRHRWRATGQLHGHTFPALQVHKNNRFEDLLRVSAVANRT